MRGLPLEVMEKLQSLTIVMNKSRKVIYTDNKCTILPVLNFQQKTILILMRTKLGD
jgi:hypothetical protein